MRLNNINGYYNPSFFNMVLETDENILDAINKYSSTFVHEFIHYLQDLILPYNIRVNLSKLRWFINFQRSTLKMNKVVCPFDDWDEDSKTTILQFVMSIGSGGFVDVVQEVENITSKYEKDSGFDGIYSMKYRDFNVYTYDMIINGGKIYNLGARDLLEYIAHKIEVKHFNDEFSAYQLPYESVDVLFDYYGLSDVSEDMRICIAEVCLYNDNPIRFLFVNFLDNEDFKKQLKHMDYQRLYNTFLSLEFQSTDGVKETITHKTNRRLLQIEKELSLYYTEFAEIKKWIGKVHDYTINEFKNKFIFSDMYLMDNDSFEKIILEVLDNIGLPLVLNSKEESVSLNWDSERKSEYVQFYILQKFFDLVVHKGEVNKCPIYSFCTMNEKMSQKECNREIQLDYMENSVCPYYRFLQSHNLAKVLTSSM